MPGGKRIVVALVMVSLLAAACGSGEDDDQSGRSLSATEQPTAEVEASTEPPLATTSSTVTDDIPIEPELAIAGPEEVVFDWSEQACEPNNIPDLAARAFRDAGDLVHLVLSHDVTYQMTGPSLNELTMDCSPISFSDLDADPAAFNDGEWISSPYTEDGNTFFALVHNEYRGHTHPGVCPTGDYFDCLDTSVTLAKSVDGGLTFTDALPPPGHLVATMPQTFDPTLGPSGTRTPSNIIRGPDGAFYSFMNISEPATQEQWVCAMRGTDLADPASWRFWNGTEFAGAFTNPYEVGNEGQQCAPLDRDDIGASLNESVTLHELSGRYILVGLSADHIDGREVWGFYYSTSTDLVDWSHRRLLTEIKLPWTVPNPGTDVSYLYPTLIDPDSQSPNFETVDDSVYLYYTRHNQGQGNLDRDLLRVPVQIAVPG